jgi:hypothetical protein
MNMNKRQIEYAMKISNLLIIFSGIIILVDLYLTLTSPIVTNILKAMTLIGPVLLFVAFLIRLLVSSQRDPK